MLYEQNHLICVPLDLVLSVPFTELAHILQASVLSSFLCLSTIPFVGFAALCLSIQQLLDIWVVTFWLL